MSVYRQFCEKASARLRPAVFILFALVIAGCTTTGGQTPQYRYPPGQQGQMPPNTNTPQTQPNTETQDSTGPDSTNPVPQDKDDTRAGLTPSFMDAKTIRRVALILPFSDANATLRQEAQGILHAAELSIFSRDDDDVLLMAIDGKGTEGGTKNAVRQAVAQGADVILGPIKSKSVHAAGKEAVKSKIPVIGFSNDIAVAGNGVYLLSFPPEAETKRIVDFAASQGATKFAFLGPNSAYGQRVLSAYREEIAATGGALTAAETYSGNDITVMQAPAERLTRVYLNAQESNEPAYHAILMPEGGTALRSLAPLLPYYSDSLRDVQFMGTGRWNNKDTAKEPALNGGIFAGPETDGKAAFEANFDATFAEDVGSLTSLGYDGLSIAAFVAQAQGNDRFKRLEDPAGFYGTDGFVRFDRSGRPQRGLAVFQIRNGRIVELDPAPQGPESAS